MQSDLLHVVIDIFLRYADHRLRVARQQTFGTQQRTVGEIVCAGMHDPDDRHARRQRAHVERGNGRVREDDVRLERADGAMQKQQTPELPGILRREDALDAVRAQCRKSSCSGISDAMQTSCPSR